MAFAVRPFGLLRLDAFHLPPIQIDQTTTCEFHELVQALPPEMAVHSATQRFRPADVRLDAHQLCNQAFID